MSSLQDSIAQDVVRLQQYVNTSTATLTKQPLTMEQIGQAHASHSDIIKQMPEVVQPFLNLGLSSISTKLVLLQR